MTESSSATNPTTTKPQLPWRTRLALSLISTISDQSRRQDLSINRRLLNFFDFKSSPTTCSSSSSSPVLSADFTVDPSRNLWCRLYSPRKRPQNAVPVGKNESPPPLPVLIFFHGGGFSYLSASSTAYDLVCKRFVKRIGCHVVSVNYRLAPEHKFPSQYDDGFDVLKFLDDTYCNNSSKTTEGIRENNEIEFLRSDGGVSEIITKSFDLSKCFLAGDSAGANIAHHVAVRACRAGFRTLKVVGLVSIQPFFGGEERTESELQLTDAPLVSVWRTDWSWKVFLPKGSNRDHYAVNVSGPNAEDIMSLDGFPEAMVVVGGFDPLKDWQRRYYEWLKRSGKEGVLIEYPNMIHAFYVFPELKESSDLFS